MQFSYAYQFKNRAQFTPLANDGTSRAKAVIEAATADEAAAKAKLRLREHAATNPIMLSNPKNPIEFILIMPQATVHRGDRASPPRMYSYETLAAL